MEARAATLIADVIRAVARGHETGGRDVRGVLIGLVGRGIGGSRSPRMHEREGRRLGLRYTYVLIDFDSHQLENAALGEVVRVAAATGFAGLNVTHPFKQAIIAHMTDLAPEAAAIGAVNTVLFEGTRRIGHNTDSWGFAESFRASMGGSDVSTVVQLGAGGAGAAVGYGLLELGTAVLEVYDPDQDRACNLATRLADRFGRPVLVLADANASVSQATGVVNATPVGMDKYPGVPFEAGVLTARQWVADVVYFPAETELLRRARAMGCRTLAGTGMAIFQAVKAFELFTGLVPDKDAMAQHFEAAA